MHYPFKKILCPIQFEDSDQTALMLASQIAKHMDATIYLLNVVIMMQAVDAPDAAVAANKSASTVKVATVGESVPAAWKIPRYVSVCV